ncbi:MAG: TIGR01212 family radical SAM protein [Lachnospiraceae bacterium]|nr:TIGR01212 family radical SAM protein [Lachnospiraceae bacterium]MBO5082417.1 TIGR01212 family radical SAM protein [Lachnospiraceae bacterium]
MYKSLNQHLKERFGTKVYKIALSSGCTCPNRDGTVGVGGCIFCADTGSGDFAQSATLPIKEQIKLAKEKVASKNKGGKYIAYFQSFTNTYGSVEFLEPKFLEAMEDDEVVAVSIATRPDCLPEEILDMLSRLNAIKPVWVELGLQTIHPQTAEYIRRGYSLEVYDKAVKDLHAIGVEVITHVIIGLPGETKEDMLQTVRYVVESKAEGIKLQLLHVIEGTDLAKDYEAENFNTLTMEEYLQIIKACVDLIPETMVIHRLTGDGNKKTLIAPLWSADKKRVLNELNKVLCTEE